MLANQQFSRDGLETFLPTIDSPLPHGGFKAELLFPGYLFIRCDPDSNGWPILRSEHRTLGWLGIEGTVIPLPEAEIDDLRKYVETVNSRGGIWRRYQAGETVNVVSSTISGLAKVFEEPRSPQSRVRVLIEFMGRYVLTLVPPQNINPVDPILGRTQMSGKRERRTRGRRRWIKQVGQNTAASN